MSDDPERVDGDPVVDQPDDDDDGGVGWVIAVAVFAALAALLGNDGGR